MVFGITVSGGTGLVAREKQLGVFVKIPRSGRVKTRLVPPLTAEEASGLYRAFVSDSLARMKKLKNLRTTVFFHGGTSDTITDLIPKDYRLSAQTGEALGNRLRGAFDMLLKSGAGPAVIIGSDSPDLPLPYVKRAFVKLKHKDVVIGPATDGGYYLIGLRKPAPVLFENIPWGESGVFGETLARVQTAGLSIAVLPVWYDVDTSVSLKLLANMISARHMEKSARLPATEAFLDEIRHKL